MLKLVPELNMEMTITENVYHVMNIVTAVPMQLQLLVPVVMLDGTYMKTNV